MVQAPQIRVARLLMNPFHLLHLRTLTLNDMSEAPEAAPLRRRATLANESDTTEDTPHHGDSTCTHFACILTSPTPRPINALRATAVVFTLWSTPSKPSRRWRQTARTGNTASTSSKLPHPGAAPDRTRCSSGELATLAPFRRAERRSYIEGPLRGVRKMIEKNSTVWMSLSRLTLSSAPSERRM